MKKIIVILSTLVVWSCSGSKEGENTGTVGGIDVEEAIKDAESRRKADPGASGGNTCLLDYQTKLDQLLTAGMVISATGFSENLMDSSYRKIMSPANHEVSYRFKNGRKGKVRGLKGEYDLKDIISVGSVKAMSLTQFEDSYRVITEEEEKLAEEAFEDVTEGKSGDPQADEALKKAKESNTGKETIKKSGGALINAFKEVSEGYRVEKGLGDAARWNVVTNRLTVLQNGVQFELVVEISNSTEENREMAVAIAKEIMKKCP